MAKKVRCMCSRCGPNGPEVSPKVRLAHENRDATEEAQRKYQTLYPPPNEPTSATASDPSHGTAVKPLHELDLAQVIAPIFELCCVLVAWLNLCAGVSRRTANNTLRALRFILTTTLQLLAAALAAAGVTATVSKVKIPLDIRTVYSRQHLNPDITRTAICPQCFSPYPSHAIPTTCSWKKSPRSRKCGAELWMQRKTRQGLKRVPRCLYTTQTFESWLSFFLSRPHIEEILQRTFTRNQAQRTVCEMHDVQDSPAWRSFRNFLRSPLHLVFAMYIDWFNPFTNKAAGKVISCGVIILYCLNLPPEVRLQRENIFVVGIIPGPHAPTLWTTSHILGPFQQMIQKFDLPGRQMATYCHPLGIMVAARIIPLLADLAAIRKVAGFLGHAAGAFCSFCTCPDNQIEELNSANWSMRDGTTVRRQAERWKSLVTVTAKEELAKQTGVRWSPLHDFAYWDPVKHVILGVMHNFFEGVLQCQLRTLWGIGRKKKDQKQSVEDGQDEAYSEQDLSESADELSDLADEEAEHRSHPDDEDGDDDDDVDIYDEFKEVDEDSRARTPTQEMPDLDEDLDDDMEDDDFTPSNLSGAFNFTESQLELIRSCIRNTLLPTWVQRPPSNLGEGSHGKLKANEYLILFICILPLILPELWWDGDETDTQLLESFCDLVAATNIIASFSTSSSDADRYTSHYIKYRQSIQQLYHNFHSLPNHHYAMHNGDLLKFWGPMVGLSEFAGERSNGELGRIKTNRRSGNMELTMVMQSNRRGRLTAFLQDNSIRSPYSQALAGILQPEDIHGAHLCHDASTEPLSSRDVAAFEAKGSILDSDHYARLLQYLRNAGNPYRAYTQYPHPYEAQALILSPVVHYLSQKAIDGRMYSHKLSNEGNSHIQFCDPQDESRSLTGFIESIWELPVQGILQTFFLVRLHRQLQHEDRTKSPYFSDARLASKLVDAEDSFQVMIIEPRHIRTHLAVYRRPKNTYGIKYTTMVVCWALNRGRR